MYFSVTASQTEHYKTAFLFTWAVHGWLHSNLMWSLCLGDAPHLGVTLTSHMTLIAHSLFWDTQNTPPPHSTHTHTPTHAHTHTHTHTDQTMPPFISLLSLSPLSLSLSLSLCLLLCSHQLFINMVKVKTTERITSVPLQPCWPESAPVISHLYVCLNTSDALVWRVIFFSWCRLTYNHLVMWECHEKLRCFVLAAVCSQFGYIMLWTCQSLFCRIIIFILD